MKIFMICKILIVLFGLSDVSAKRTRLLMARRGDYSFAHFYSNNKRMRFVFFIYNNRTEEKEFYLYKNGKIQKTSIVCVKKLSLGEIKFPLNTCDGIVKKRIHGKINGSYTGAFQINATDYLAIIEMPHTQNNFYLLSGKKMTAIDDLKPIVDYENTHISYSRAKRTIIFSGYKKSGRDRYAYGLYSFNLRTKNTILLHKGRHKYNGTFFPLIVVGETKVFYVYIAYGKLCEAYITDIPTHRCPSP